MLESQLEFLIGIDFERYSPIWGNWLALVTGDNYNVNKDPITSDLPM